MYIKNILLLLMMLSGFAGQTRAQSAYNNLRDGDSEFRTKRYKEAAQYYEQASQKKPSAEALYNLGVARYNEGKYEDAAKALEESTVKFSDPQKQANAYYNLGNAYMQTKKFDKSVQSYIEALKRNPSDIQAKHNLTLAQKQLKEQQEQQKQQQQNKQDQNKDQNKDKEQQDKQQNNQDKNKQDKQQQKDESSSSDDKSGKDKDQPQDQQPQEEPKPGAMNKEQAKRLLQMMDQEEKKVQGKLRKGTSKPNASSKDW